ncbi:hypothetical protein [Scytonema sp. NUACC21]
MLNFKFWNRLSLLQMSELMNAGKNADFPFVGRGAACDAMEQYLN